MALMASALSARYFMMASALSARYFMVASALSARYFLASLVLWVPRSPTARLWHPFLVFSSWMTARSVPRMFPSCLDNGLSERAGRYGRI